METIEQRIEKIEERNRRVEIDKEWEKSICRKLLLAVFTYIIAGAYLSVVGLPWPWISAFVPAGGFLLSTLTLSYFKDLWVKKRKLQ